MTFAVRIAAVVLMTVVLFLVRPDAAQARALYDDSCVLAMDDPVSFETARASNQWHCHPSRYRAQAEHAWIRIAGDALPQGRFEIQGYSMASNGVLVVAVDADGRVLEEFWSANRIARSWTAGPRFSLPVAIDGARIRELYLRFDEPLGRQAMTGLNLISSESAATQKVWLMTVLGLLVGMLLIVSLYSAALALALRSRFALHHFCGTSLLMLYSVASSSIIFMVFPDFGLWNRSIVTHAALAWSIAALGPFMLHFLERGVMSRWTRRAVRATGLLMIAAGFLLPIMRVFEINLRAAYYCSFIPALAAIVWLMAEAWLRGSRAVRVLTLAWMLPIAVLIERIGRGLNLTNYSQMTDFNLYLALSAEAVVMTMAIAWRVHQVRRERDEALVLGHRLADEALTDALTALPNRRDFDRRVWRRTDMLGILDLDRFKRVNDTYGHETGDEVLRVTGRLLESKVRSGQLLRAWRLGGEEFAVAIAASSIDEGAIVLNAIRDGIRAEIAARVPDVKFAVTASAGVARIGEEGMRKAYRAADSALYTAKSNGRNRLCWETGHSEIATIFPRRRFAA